MMRIIIAALCLAGLAAGGAQAQYGSGCDWEGDGIESTEDSVNPGFSDPTLSNTEADFVVQAPVCAKDFHDEVTHVVIECKAEIYFEGSSFRSESVGIQTIALGSGDARADEVDDVLIFEASMEDFDEIEMPDGSAPMRRDIHGFTCDLTLSNTGSESGRTSPFQEAECLDYAEEWQCADLEAPFNISETVAVPQN